MVALVTLEIALRREFDYLVPSEMEATVGGTAFGVIPREASSWMPSCR